MTGLNRQKTHPEKQDGFFFPCQGPGTYLIDTPATLILKVSEPLSVIYAIG